MKPQQNPNSGGISFLSRKGGQRGNGGVNRGGSERKQLSRGVLIPENRGRRSLLCRPVRTEGGRRVVTEKKIEKITSQATGAGLQEGSNGCSRSSNRREALLELGSWSKLLREEERFTATSYYCKFRTNPRANGYKPKP
ncbi:hypothetical protein NE237_004475 [Protea cynaroides]|uniref:Uncharacterized protein n=1 Tax=Protea cynaroides TaxID=273540 RepID=A0A9Q0KJH6_9MAGN|nr:hypothetical protein NE237_004475 [Protea cynaroides]